MMAMTLEVHRQAAMLLRPGITTGEVKRFIDEAHRALGACPCGLAADGWRDRANGQIELASQCMHGGTPLQPGMISLGTVEKRGKSPVKSPFRGFTTLLMHVGIVILPLGQLQCAAVL